MKAANSGLRMNGQFVQPSNTVFFKRYASTAYPLNGTYRYTETGHPKILGDATIQPPFKVCNVLLPTGNECPL